MLRCFLNYLQYEKCYSSQTVTAYKTDIVQLQHAVKVPLKQVDSKALRTFIMSLAEKGLSAQAINRKIAAYKTFYHFLLQNNQITLNPTIHLSTRKLPKMLPCFIQEAEMKNLLDSVPIKDTFVDTRNHFIMELLYGTGIRLGELLQLRLQDVHLTSKVIKVIGKGSKERLIPFPTMVLHSFDRYIKHRKAQTSWLITTSTGKKAYPMLIYRIVKKYLQCYTNVSKQSPHALRHTYATHLLAHGADLNAIKTLLGHTSLSATQVYTHQSLEQLQKIFKQAHPRA